MVVKRKSCKTVRKTKGEWDKVSKKWQKSWDKSWKEAQEAKKKKK